MIACHEYVELCGGLTRGIALDEVRRYMLREFGLSFYTTSSILRDLTRIGRVIIIDGKVKVTLQKDEANVV